MATRALRRSWVRLSIDVGVGLSLVLFVVTVVAWVITRDNWLKVAFQLGDRWVQVGVYSDEIEVTAVSPVTAADPIGYWYRRNGDTDPFLVGSPVASLLYRQHLDGQRSRLRS